MKIGTTTIASGSKLVWVPLGEKLELLARFQMPNSDSQIMDMVLRTKKTNGTKDVIKFEEGRRFEITDYGGKGATWKVVQINDS